ncbi:MAG: SpoIIE family protein phosphatase, partial [Proteobacteria bacterium]|nr:SpoIIE family protein phosphatase [Pseudomonadota bacterium]
QKALSKKNTDLVQTAIARTAPSGFQDVYEDSSGRRKLGAYSQIPGYNNLYAIVEKDAEAAFLAITRNYYSATLWALLFTFMAILLSFVGAGSATRSIRDLVTVTREIASGNFTARALPRSKDEIAELGTSVNHMAGRITALLSNEVEKARYEKELETARMVQSTFFPKQDVRLGPLTATGYYQPATECGGDLWGHYKVDEHRQLLFIADVMGHGAPAALVTAIGYAICQAVASILVDEPNLNSSPSKLLERLNMIIYDAVEGKISMTFFAAMLDFSTGVMTYANAGHNFPVIMTRNPDDARVGKAAKAKPASAYIIPLQLQGTPLGIDRAAEFKEKQTSICAGDLIFLFTDGLIENQLPEGKPMGRKNLIEMLAQWGDQDCFGVKKSALDAATALFGSTNLNDDVTIVVAEIDKNWSKGDSAIETTLVTANNA